MYIIDFVLSSNIFDALTKPKLAYKLARQKLQIFNVNITDRDGKAHNYIDGSYSQNTNSNEKTL